MRRRRAIAKKIPFVRFGECSQNHQDGAIFVNTEGLRPCLSKLSYGASIWALMACLMQKKRLKSPQKSLL